MLDGRSFISDEQDADIIDIGQCDGFVFDGDAQCSIDPIFEIIS